MSDEELSDEQAVTVEEEELEALKAAQERENKFSSVQVGDGGASGSNWVTVDEDGNIIDNKPSRKTAEAPRDLSPPRRSGGGGGGGGGGDLSPPRRRGGKSADASPPRRGAGGGGGDGDYSPPRRAAGGGGRKQRHDSDSDQSPPRARAPAARRWVDVFW